MKSLEIFSGAGGLAHGLKLAGFEHKALVELNENACRSLERNFTKANIIQKDIRKFDYKKYSEIDVLAGGPPCQPFSLGGKHQGYHDDRDMFPHAIRGIRELAPKAFVFENVKGLLRQSFSKYFNYILLQLTYPEVSKAKEETWNSHLCNLEQIHTKDNYRGLKYNIVFRLVNVANYGVPQKRERVIIIGIRESLNIKFSFPIETHSQERLLWDKFVTRSYWDKHKIPLSQQEQPNTTTQKKVEKLKHYYGIFEPTKLPWTTVRDTIYNLPDPQAANNNIKDHEFRGGAKAYSGHTGSYIDEPSKTIKAGDHGVPGGENMIRFENGSVRYFTLLETKRIQTFNDDYQIVGSWTEGMRQLGNAVPVKLGYILGSSLKSQLSTRYKWIDSNIR